MNTSKLHGLYAITDSQLISETSFKDSITSVLEGGASIIQYRDKSSDSKKRISQAHILRELCSQYDALFIVNDDINLALNSHADGIHLGKNDTSIHDARSQLGENAIIGYSCYNDIQLAEHAQQQHADYVAFGAVFPSLTKPNATTVSLVTLNEAKSNLDLPICAIGGITANNAKPLIDSGVDMIAVISDIFGHSNIRERSEALSKLFM